MNLEAPHRRQAEHLFSSDHVLDVWIRADGNVQMKDQDVLQAAVERALFSAPAGQQIEDDARAARGTVRAGAFPFDDPWRDWRPDPAWSRPGLPTDVTWLFDQLHT